MTENLIRSKLRKVQALNLGKYYFEFSSFQPESVEKNSDIKWLECRLCSIVVTDT